MTNKMAKPLLEVMPKPPVKFIFGGYLGPINKISIHNARDASDFAPIGQVNHI